MYLNIHYTANNFIGAVFDASKKVLSARNRFTYYKLRLWLLLKKKLMKKTNRLITS